MELSNESVFEFLSLYEKETILWDPKHPLHNNRNEYQASWKRIQSGYSCDCSIEDLKRRKESLLARYRALLRRVHQTAASGSGEVYKPSWFAFERMSSFLGPVYQPKSTNKADSNSQTRRMGIVTDGEDATGDEESSLEMSDHQKDHDIEGDAISTNSWKNRKRVLEEEVHSQEMVQVSWGETSVEPDLPAATTVSSKRAFVGDHRLGERSEGASRRGPRSSQELKPRPEADPLSRYICTVLKNIRHEEVYLRAQQALLTALMQAQNEDWTLSRGVDNGRV